MSYWQQRIQQLKEKNFRRYVTSCAFSTLCTGLVYVAMAWQNIQLGGSVVSLMIMMLVFWVPNILLGPIFGVIVDRYPRRRLLLIVIITRAVFMAGFAVAMLMLKHISFWLLDVFSFIQGVLFTLLFPSVITFVREIVAESKLLYANSTIDMVYEVGNIIGYGAAGILMRYMGAPAVYLVGSGCLFLSALILLGVKPQFIKPLQKRKLLSFVDDMRVGFKYICQHKPLIIIYLVQILLMAQYMTTPTLLAPFVHKILHGRVGVFGNIELSCSIGIILGGIVLPWLADKRGLINIILGCIVLLILSYIGFSFNRVTWTAELLYFFMGIGFAVWALLVTQGQTLTELAYQGRVQATFNSLSGIMVSLMYIFIGMSSYWIPLAKLYWLEAVLGMLGIILLLCFRRMHTAHPRAETF